MHDILGQLTTSSEQCTRAGHLVLRPWELSSPIKQAQRKGAASLVRYLTAPEGRHYVICMRAAALNFRTEFEMASRGL